MTCTQAWTRYRGDYAYRRAVDAGSSTAEREVFAKTSKTARVVVESKAEASKRTPQVKPKAKRIPQQKRRAQRLHAAPVNGFTHGIPYGAKFCTGVCPAEAAGGKSCLQAKRDYQTAYGARRRAGDGPALRHGTKYAYQMGCQTVERCPEPAGKTCSDVSAAYGKQYSGAAPRLPKVPPEHGTRAGYRVHRCRAWSVCPAEQAGGESCSTVNSKYQVQYRAAQAAPKLGKAA